MEVRRFHSCQTFFVFSLCVVFTFGQTTDSTCFKPEVDSYVVRKDQFMTYTFSMSGFETCSDELRSVFVGTNVKDAPNYERRTVCQVLLTDIAGKSDNCFYNPSTKKLTGMVAFHETGEMILTITGLYKNDSILIAQPKASIAITVIKATETSGSDDDNNSKINTILFSSIGCVVFLIIIIAILCGIVIRRKVSAPTHPPPAPVLDENVIELQQVPATQGAGNRVSALSAHVYQEIADDFIPESSTDVDGYMQPRPWVLPSRSTRPKQGPLLPSGRGNISSPSSSASYANTPSTSYANTLSTSYANTASGTISARPTAPLQTSAKTGASVVKPQPNESDALEASTGGYMPMGGTTGGYMRMTRPTTPASATHSSPQTSAVETLPVYANDEKEVRKCTQPAVKAKEQPYENMK